MAQDGTTGQSGGVNISGAVGSVGGDIVGRDKFVGLPSAAQLEQAFGPLEAAIGNLDPPTRSRADDKLGELKGEVAKGKAANDGVIAKLVDGFVALVPNAAASVVSAFGTPLLGSVTGPVTTFVLEKLRGDS